MVRVKLVQAMTPSFTALAYATAVNRNPHGFGLHQTLWWYRSNVSMPPLQPIVATPNGSFFPFSLATPNLKFSAANPPAHVPLAAEICQRAGRECIVSIPSVDTDRLSCLSKRLERITPRRHVVLNGRNFLRFLEMDRSAGRRARNKHEFL